MKKHKAFSLFYLAIFLQSGVYGMVLLMPILFRNIGGNEQDVGLFQALIGLTTITTVLLSGKLADRFGQMNALALSGGILCVSLFLFTSTNTLGLVAVIASLVLGIGWGLFFALKNVVLTLITKPHERLRHFSIKLIAMMAGFGLSPVAGSLMMDQGMSILMVFKIMAVICLLSAGIFLRLNPFVNSVIKSTVERTRVTLTLSAVISIFKSRSAAPLYLVLMSACLFAGMNNFQTVIAEAKGFHYDQYFLTYSFVVIACRLCLTKFKPGDYFYPLVTGLFLVIVSSIILLFYTDQHAWQYILVAVLFAVGYGFVHPMIQTLAANKSNSANLAQTMQLFSLCHLIGIFGFPLIAGWMIVNIGFISLFVLLGVIAFICGLIALMQCSFACNSFMQTND